MFLCYYEGQFGWKRKNGPYGCCAGMVGKLALAVRLGLSHAEAESYTELRKLLGLFHTVAARFQE